MAIVDHVLLTRFNLPSGGREGMIRAREGWLRERVELFLRYTVPSVAAQTAPVRWIVYLDPASPAWLIERLRPLVERGAFEPVYREEVSAGQIPQDARALVSGDSEILITTNLDNDDALAADFAERVQAHAVAGQRRAVFLADGLIRRGERLYRRRDSDNAFVSVAEPWDAPATAWCDWHTLVHRHMPVVSVPGEPAWLQIVHGRNVSNRVRGRLENPERHRSRFPALLDDVPGVGTWPLFSDAWLARPVREAREVVRQAGKRAVLAAFGKAGLDAVKDRLPALRAGGAA